MSSRKQLLLIAAISFGLFASAQAADLPRRIGECVDTTIKAVETRLVDGQTNKPVPGSGSAVNFTNGGYQVSYETVPAIERSKAGDPARMCLVFIPSDCPKGDVRGREYKTTNLRTRQSWRLPDSEHRCGGA
jgi:hypothetical protein